MPRERVACIQNSVSMEEMMLIAEAHDDQEMIELLRNIETRIHSLPEENPELFGNFLGLVCMAALEQKVVKLTFQEEGE